MNNVYRATHGGLLSVVDGNIYCITQGRYLVELSSDKEAHVFLLERGAVKVKL